MNKRATRTEMEGLRCYGNMEEEGGSCPEWSPSRKAASKGIQGGRRRTFWREELHGQRPGGTRERVQCGVFSSLRHVPGLFPNLPQRGQSVWLATGFHTRCKGLTREEGQNLFALFLSPWFQHVLHIPADTKESRLVPSFLIWGSACDHL